MTDRPRDDFNGEAEQSSDLAPETRDAEHDDAASQAQTIAADAHGASALGLSDSEKVGGGDPDLADVQDLVDHMNQMVSSGRIDMSAFRGEPNLDDEDGTYGDAADEE